MAFEELASVDGEIAPTAQTAIPVCDDGLYRGDGVFEVIRLYSGCPFALAEHLDRLERSAAAIELPVDREAIDGEVAVLLEGRRGRRAAADTAHSRGAADPADRGAPAAGHNRESRDGHLRPDCDPDGRQVALLRSQHAGDADRCRARADEAVLVRPDGIVLEAPTSSIFWVSAEGPLRTPALSTGILESITRSKVIRELHVEEGEYELDDLLTAHGRSSPPPPARSRPSRPSTVVGSRPRDRGPSRRPRVSPAGSTTSSTPARPPDVRRRA